MNEVKGTVASLGENLEVKRAEGFSGLKGFKERKTAMISWRKMRRGFESEATKIEAGLKNEETERRNVL